MEKYNLTYDCIAVGAGDPSLTLPMLVLARFDCGGGVALRPLGALRRVRADELLRCADLLKLKAVALKFPNVRVSHSATCVVPPCC